MILFKLKLILLEQSYHKCDNILINN